MTKRRSIFVGPTIVSQTAENLRTTFPEVLEGTETVYFSDSGEPLDRILPFMRKLIEREREREDSR